MDVEIDITNVALNTERLTIRAWQESDVQDFYEYASVDGVGEMAGWKHHESIEKSKEILNVFMDEKNVFALELRENKKVIGSLGLHYFKTNDDPKLEKLKTKEIGYVLAKDYWGRGLMPEAVQAVIKFCFESLGLDALTAGHFLKNAQSKRVIEKCGFTHLGPGDFFARGLNKTLKTENYILYNKK